MRELVLTDDAVLVSYIETLLGDAGIDVVVLDRNLNQLHGAVGRVPQRLMVPDERWSQARSILKDADLGKWLVSGDD
jgi:hypothetical protein